MSTLDAGADQRRFEPPGQARRIVDHGPPLAAADVADRVDRVQVAAGEALDVRNPRQAGAAHAPAITRRVIERYVELDGAAGRSCPTPMAEAVARAGLTDREREVLVALAAGWSNTELAAELHLSEATVKTHVSSVLAKLGLRSRVQAVNRRLRVGPGPTGRRPLQSQAGKADGEGGADAHGALDGDRAAQDVDQLVAHGEAETAATRVAGPEPVGGFLGVLA